VPTGSLCCSVSACLPRFARLCMHTISPRGRTRRVNSIDSNWRPSQDSEGSRANTRPNRVTTVLSTICAAGDGRRSQDFHRRRHDRHHRRPPASAEGEKPTTDRGSSESGHSLKQTDQSKLRSMSQAPAFISMVRGFCAGSGGRSDLGQGPGRRCPIPGCHGLLQVTVLFGRAVQ
jgi:hypothetical protein